jgi:hypothetical protein
MTEKRKAREQSNLPETVYQEIERGNNPSSGLYLNNIVEPVPTFNRGDSEQVFKNLNNSWIVLGRDRPSRKDSGYGGAGGTQCGSIDLVVGRMSSVEGGPKSDIYVDPNFTSDAARIYISQKTDIDENFDLVPGGVGLSKAKSGIGIKADAIRIIGREGIKLVTNTDKKNSQGGRVKSTFGIDLIAGNDDSEQNVKGTFRRVDFLQPIVKGDNLVEALEELVDQVGDLATRFDQFAQTQVRYNASLATHTHLIPPLPFAAIPSIELAPAFIAANIQQFTNAIGSAWSQSMNLSNFKMNYLKPYGDRWICSRYNRTT